MALHDIFWLTSSLTIKTELISPNSSRNYFIRGWSITKYSTSAVSKNKKKILFGKVKLATARANFEWAKNYICKITLDCRKREKEILPPSKITWISWCNLPRLFQDLQCLQNHVRKFSRNAKYCCWNTDSGPEIVEIDRSVGLWSASSKN